MLVAPTFGNVKVNRWLTTPPGLEPPSVPPAKSVNERTVIWAAEDDSTENADSDSTNNPVRNTPVQACALLLIPMI